MRLLVFEVESSPVLSAFLDGMLGRARIYPMNIIFTRWEYKLVVLGGVGEKDLLFLAFETGLFNFLPNFFFKKLFFKGLRKAGFSGFVRFLRFKDALLRCADIK